METVNGQNVKKDLFLEKIKVFFKVMLAVWTLSEQAHSVLTDAYTLSVPGIKQIFFVLLPLNGWGIKNLAIAAGLAVIFWKMREEQKAIKTTILSLFFAVTTVLGMSYQETGSWDYLFYAKRQFLLGVLVIAGYYIIYKNCILLGVSVFRRHREFFYCEPRKRVEIWMFDKHPFAGPFLFFLLCGLPWIICFFPGTMQWDGHAQLWMALGVNKITGHYPVISTRIMGTCILLGRSLFQSDSIGLAFYTIPQFLIQCLVFGYGCMIMRKWKCPVVLSKGALFLWGVFPLFQIWGITLVKDTGYYIFMVLFVTAFTDITIRKEGVERPVTIFLLMLSIIGGTLARKEGKYIFIFTLAFALLLLLGNPKKKGNRKKYVIVYITGILLCVGVDFSVEKIYMPLNQIPAGGKVEALSIPLQQTARYLRENYEDITLEEKEILEDLFGEDLLLVAEAYNPVLSDPVKGLIKDEEDLREYFSVWKSQFARHPDTYLQAFLNHIYGYFYPDALYIGERIWDGRESAVSWIEKPWYFKIGNSEHWQDGHLDIKFAISNEQPRRILESFAETVQRMPVIGMLFSPGLYVYIVIAIVYSEAGTKRWREIQILFPAIGIVLVSMFSPVNAYLRYILPVIAMMPILISAEAARRGVYEREDEI